MENYKKYLIIFSIASFVATVLIILSLTIKPNLVEDKDLKWDIILEDISEMRDENYMFPSQTSVDQLNSLNLTNYDGETITFDYVSVTLPREGYVELENSALIRYDSEQYHIRLDDYTQVIYSSTNFGLVDPYVRNYFTVNDVNIYQVTDNIFYTQIDPASLFEYSESELNDYKSNYYDNNIAGIVFWIDFFDVAFVLSILVIAISLPSAIWTSIRIKMYSGFPSIKEAKEHYEKVSVLKKKKKERLKLQKNEEKHQKALKELENLENEFNEDESK